MITLQNFEDLEKVFLAWELDIAKVGSNPFAATAEQRAFSSAKSFFEYYVDVFGEA